MADLALEIISQECNIAVHHTSIKGNKAKFIVLLFSNYVLNTFVYPALS